MGEEKENIPYFKCVKITLIVFDTLAVIACVVLFVLYAVIFGRNGGKDKGLYFIINYLEFNIF